MRVVPAQGMALRDPRTRRLVDPELGAEVPETDVTFAWLLSHGDCVELSDADYTAALAKREADEAAAAEAAAKGAEPPAAPPTAPAAAAKSAPPPVAAVADQGADA